MTVDGVLLTFLGWMAGAVQHVWSRGFTPGVVLHMLATAALITTVAISLLHVFHIISPRLKRSSDKVGRSDHGKQVRRAELLFFLDIIHSHANDAEYANALLTATPEELLSNLSTSIYGASISAQE